MAAALAALLWDVDGTLAETELQGHRLAYNRAFRDQQLDWHWDEATYRRLLAVSGGRERLQAFGQERDTRLVAGDLEALMTSKARHYRQLVDDGGLTLRPGVARLLEEAAAAGLAQVIVTTSSRQAVEALSQAVLGPLAHRFRFWVCGEDVPRKKPDPAGYRLALTQLGLEPSAALALEDSPQGLAASRGAGLACMLTLAACSEPHPLRWGQSAAAVVDGLGDGTEPVTVLQGPPCPTGRVDLAYLQGLKR